ncbi:MAG: hypothetical protein ACE5E6_05760 [Phycisphaerae bacterium]
MNGMRGTTVVTVLGALTVAVCTGCPERKETITVARDGRVSMVIEYADESDQLVAPDAVPTRAGGWDVVRDVRQDGDKRKHVLTARQTFPPGAPLPRRFGLPDDPDGEIVLDFPTTLETERRSDGVYYHFRRVYTPRKWAYVQYDQDRIQKELDAAKLGDQPLDELSRQDRIKLARLVVSLDAARHVELARAALQHADPDLTQDHWLIARRALLRAYLDLNYDDLVDRYVDLPEDERAGAWEREAGRIKAAAHDALVAVLRRQAGYDDARVAGFERAFEHEQRYYDITNATGGHAFHIRVRMPGDVVAHNADDIDDDGLASWSFDGNAFRDREHVVMITSRVAADR